MRVVYRYPFRNEKERTVHRPLFYSDSELEIKERTEAYVAAGDCKIVPHLEEALVLHLAERLALARQEQPPAEDLQVRLVQLQQAVHHSTAERLPHAGEAGHRLFVYGSNCNR